MIQNAEILNSFSDSISIVNQEGKIIFTNNAWENFSMQNAGSKDKTGIGVGYIELCNKVTGQELEDAKDAVNGIKKVIHRESAIFELEYPCHSFGTQRWFIMRVAPHTTDLEWTIISHIDITKRKLAEQEIENQNQKLKIVNERLNTTLLRIVHDIQNPITSIEALVSLTKMDNENQPASPYFGLIESSIANLKEYIQETLEMAAVGVIVESINFKDLLVDFFDSIKYMAELKNINVEMNVKQSIGFYSDKAKLLTIISNIINNSIKYCDTKKEEKSIRITFNVNEFEAYLSITDNGIGMSEDMVSRIFDLNFQADKNASSGSGVGLHLVQKALQSINGSVKIESTLGVGTVFIVTIPTTKKAAKDRLISQDFS